MGESVIDRIHRTTGITGKARHPLAGIQKRIDAARRVADGLSRSSGTSDLGARDRAISRLHKLNREKATYILDVKEPSKH